MDGQGTYFKADMRAGTVPGMLHQLLSRGHELSNYGLTRAPCYRIKEGGREGARSYMRLRADRAHDHIFGT